MKDEREASSEQRDGASRTFVYDLTSLGRPLNHVPAILLRYKGIFGEELKAPKLALYTPNTPDENNGHLGVAVINLSTFGVDSGTNSGFPVSLYAMFERRAFAVARFYNGSWRLEPAKDNGEILKVGIAEGKLGILGEEAGRTDRDISVGILKFRQNQGPSYIAEVSDWILKGLRKTSALEEVTRNVQVSLLGCFGGIEVEIPRLDNGQIDLPNIKISLPRVDVYAACESDDFGICTLSKQVNPFFHAVYNDYNVGIPPKPVKFAF